MKRLKALAEGRVQGVNFRRHVKSLADSYGLDGDVRNLSDGTVEISVQGPEDILHRFMEDVTASPYPIRVDKLTWDWSESDDGRSGFHIIR